jgi:FkbM family methyltransferase
MRLTRRRGMMTAGRLMPHVFPRGIALPMAGGLDLLVPPDPHFIGYIVGHDEHIARAIAESVRAGDAVVDVGANIGYFSVMMAGLVGKAGRVIAYEPEPDNFRQLDLNRLHAQARGASIEAVNAACGEREGTLYLSLGSESTLHTVVPVGRAGMRAIPAVALSDDLPRRLPGREVRLLKIDVEGFEVEVLAGAASMAREGRIEHLLVEVSSEDRARRIVEMLRGSYGRVRYWTGREWRVFAGEFEVRPRELWCTRS